MTTAVPAEVRLTDLLGPSVPDDVMLYVHAYGDSRADDDGLSALCIGETVLALRRWAAKLQAAERERWRLLLDGDHIYQGDCPEQGRWNSRDPECPACAALGEWRA